VSWLTAAEQAARNEHIMELFSMGYGRRYIAEVVDLTPARVSQIVNSFGYTFHGWWEEVRATDRDRPVPRPRGLLDGGAT
jgi:hypothetical protein